jgi:hypothetical protein
LINQIQSNASLYPDSSFESYLLLIASLIYILIQDSPQIKNSPRLPQLFKALVPESIKSSTFFAIMPICLKCDFPSPHPMEEYLTSIITPRYLSISLFFK